MSRLVVKLGGAVATQATRAVRELVAQGHEVCVVHGAGPQITERMRQRGLEVRFVHGRRYTTAEVLEVARESLAEVNAVLCSDLSPGAVGFMGDEVGLEAVQVPQLGLVGDPIPSCPAPVVEALRTGLVPVVAPLARGPLNVNADEAAVALAAGLGAVGILFVTDAPGVLLDGVVVASLGAGEAERLLGDETFQGGIVPKLEAAIRAARLGMRSEIGATRILADGAAKGSAPGDTEGLPAPAHWIHIPTVGTTPDGGAAGSLR